MSAEPYIPAPALIRIEPSGMDEADLTRFRAMMGKVVERSHGRITVNSMLEDIYNRKVSLYAVTRDLEFSSFVCLRFLTYPSGIKIMRIDWAAGKLEDALAFIGDLEGIARRNGVHRIRIEGREGWKKIFPDWHHVSTLIEKEV